MITGLEPFVAVAAKGAGAGAARAAGAGAREVFKGRRRRKIRALSVGRAGLARKAVLESLPPSMMSRLLDFCGSPELEHAATCLARLYVIEGRGRPAEKLASSLRAEFDAALRLALEDEVSDDVLDAVYAAINEVVVREVQYVLAKPDLAPTLEAELLKTLGSLSAACVRNTELLEGVDELETFREFERDYRSIVAAVHSTMKLPHAGTTRQVPYEQLFVESAVHLTSEKRPEASRHEAYITIPALLASTTRAVILGDPGGGKSTLSRKLTHDLAAGKIEDAFVTRTPFFVELRDYATVVRGRNRQTLVEYLEGLCRSPYNIDAPADVIEWMLLNDRAMVILDGLDELLDTSLRRDVVEAVEGFAHRYPTCPMLVTSRRVGYSEAPLDADIFPSVQLAEFTPNKVNDYVQKWFRLDENIEPARQEALVKSFMLDSVFVADPRVNPLMLSLMCGIYASENYIPRNRPDVYEKCALLLFERWDKQRGIAAPLSFDAHVQAAMRSLALYMYKLAAAAGSVADEAQPVAPQMQEGIHRSKLVDYMKTYLRSKRFDDDESAETAAVEFIEFCKGRAWVLTDIGSDTYGFTHQTFLEYFAASQLVREHTSAEALYQQLAPYLRSGAWDVVAQLAVQILGRATEDGADDFLQLVLDNIQGTEDGDFYAVSFAIRALKFIVPRPPVVRSLVAHGLSLYSDVLKGSVSPTASVEPKLLELGMRLLPEMMSVSSENAPRVGEVLREVLAQRLEADPTDSTAIKVALAPLHRFVFAYSFPTDYWHGWAGDNLTRFAASIRILQKTLPWVAVMEFERGQVTARQMLDWHGVNCLYGLDAPTFEAVTPPFFYRYTIYRHRGGFDGTINLVTAKREVVIADQLVQELCTRKAWHVSLASAKRFHWVLEEQAYSVELQKIGPAGLLVLLPLLEARAQPEFQSGSMQEGIPVGVLTSWARLLTDVRSGAISADAASDVLKQLFASRKEDAKDFIESWLRGDVSVLASGRGSRAAGGASPDDEAYS